MQARRSSASCGKSASGSSGLTAHFARERPALPTHLPRAALSAPSALRPAMPGCSPLSHSPAVARAQVHAPLAGLAQLLLDWSRDNATFFEAFESDHGNDGRATTDEIAAELTTFASENEEELKSKINFDQNCES